MRRPIRAFFYSLVLYLFCIPGVICAASLRISWNPNTEPDLSGYRIHYGNASRSYDHTLDVGNATDATISCFLEGWTYYIAVTAYDYSGNESSFSQEVEIKVPETPGGGILLTIMTRLYDVIAGVEGNPDISPYSILDFSSADRGDIANSLSVVRIGVPGGSGQTNPDTGDTAVPTGYAIRDVITEVGEPVDLAYLYPQGTYLFLPLTNGSAVIENESLSYWEPGVYLFMVTDDSGNLVNLLRASVLDVITLFSEYVGGETSLIEDSGLGVSLELSSCAFEGDFPIGIGQSASDLNGPGAVFKDDTHLVEFAIAPFGLALSEPAEVRVLYEGPDDVAVEYYDEGEKRWIPIEGARVENGMVVFSTQSLGRFKVYPQQGDAPSADTSSSGGGCFISACGR